MDISASKHNGYKVTSVMMPCLISQSVLYSASSILQITMNAYKHLKLYY